MKPLVRSRDPRREDESVRFQRAPYACRFVRVCHLVALLALLFGSAVTADEPSPHEQLMLEYINRMRVDPQGELHRLVNFQSEIPPLLGSPTANEDSIDLAMRWFGVNPAVLLAQWSELQSVPPLVWNDALGTSSGTYSQLMVDLDREAPNLDEHGFDLRARVSASGYDLSGGGTTGANIFAYADSVLYSHAAFAIDWGWNPGIGIQDPPIHRALMMQESTQEIGIGIVQDTDNRTDVGEWVVTEHFGGRNGTGPFLTGVAFLDLDQDDFYSIGEGLGDVSVSARRQSDGEEFRADVFASGGYRLELDPGIYDLQLEGPGGWSLLRSDVHLATSNVKVDFLVDTSEQMFDIWDANKFTPGGNLSRGDFNLDGVTDVSDFHFWLAGGNGSGPALSVPEPSGIALFAVAIMCFFAWARTPDPMSAVG